LKADLIRPVDLKLARAHAQANELCAQIEKWRLQNPIKMKSELFEDRLGYQIIVTDFEESTKLEEWGILIGEFMHNLRSSLDNLAFALARLKEDPPSNPNQISFPIFQEKAEFVKKSKAKISQQLPANAADMIEKIQPFQRLNPNVDGEPNTDALVLLQWFNNIDKHRIPTVLLMVPTGDILKTATIEFYTAEDAALNVPPQVEFFGYPIKKGAILMQHKTNKPICKVNGEFTLGANVSVQGLNSIDSVEPLVKQLHYYTSLIVDQFRVFFQ